MLLLKKKKKKRTQHFGYGLVWKWNNDTKLALDILH